MFMRMFVSLLYAISIISCCAVIKNAQAVDYTTHYSNNSHGTSTSNTANAESVCTNKDIRRIKKFNDKAQRYIDGYKEYMKNIKKSATSEDNVKKLIKENKKLMKFFTSDNYSQMRNVYDRCGMKIPTINFGEMFWMPERMLGQSQGCSAYQ
ncbi:MAG: hypothetical protein KAJ40_02185 [Alphaproteobacteria bacterium]|nr:hypothetical protein [Alphaproteobacteria bacterium]